MSTTPEQPNVKDTKKAARPNSQWASGKRRAGSHKSETKGFARGAKVK